MDEAEIPQAQQTLQADTENLDNFQQPLCTECLEKNLCEDVNIQLCNKCKDRYCIHGASKIDPQYCVNCCSDFTVVEQEVQVTREAKDHSGKVIKTREHYRKITLSGKDWFFLNSAIHDMSDDRLDLSIEYHTDFKNALINEREERRVKHFQRNAGIKMPPAIFPHKPDGLTSSRTTTTKTKTKTASGIKLSQDKGVSKIMKQLQKLGFTKEQLEEYMNKESNGN